MGFYGKTWPIGLAPGMGLNAFIAFGVCKGMGYTPAQALGAVFVAGIVFLVISLTPLRAWIINSIPKSLKLGIGAGIGLFLAIIGFQIMGVVVGSIPPMTHLLTFDLSAALSASMVTVVFTLFFVDFFDTAGTLTSVANVAGKVDAQGNVKDIDKAMLSDSVATVAGSMLGTSNVTSYIESGSGVKAGGKTGMTSIVIGVCFLLCLFFAPLATSLPKEIDGAALVYVSFLFVRNIVDIEWDDISESGPAVLAMIAMPLTYSISNGMALAFISYALIKIFSGKMSNVSPAIWLIAILGFISFAI
jgi:AGZA family xanthine/uracil permease-like MFS transporter